MSIEEINIRIFNWINSGATENSFFAKAAMFSSYNLIGAFLIFLTVLLLFKDKKYQFQYFKTVVMVILSSFVVKLLHAFYHHPRPFDLGLGHTLIHHSSSSSMPSQHTLTVAIIAFSFLMSEYRQIGVFGLFVSLIVGWSRVYMGVHFPFDVLGSFVMAFLIVFSVNILIKRFISKSKQPISVQAVDV
nr:phosphatase PAP2 family protein [uncultured Acinetobacter sp.]